MTVTKYTFDSETDVDALVTAFSDNGYLVAIKHKKYCGSETVELHVESDKVKE